MPLRNRSLTLTRRRPAVATDTASRAPSATPWVVSGHCRAALAGGRNPVDVDRPEDRLDVVGGDGARPEADGEPGVDGDGRGAGGRLEGGADQGRQRHDVDRAAVVDQLAGELGRVAHADAGALECVGQVAHVVRLEVVLLAHARRQTGAELVDQPHDRIALRRHTSVQSELANGRIAASRYPSRGGAAARASNARPPPHAGSRSVHPFLHSTSACPNLRER